VTTAERLAELERALARLEEGLTAARGGSTLERDGCIQRFEFTFELAWKTLKGWLADRLPPTGTSPRAILREAFQQRVIDDEAGWIALLTDRNLTRHTYHEPLAAEVFSRLPDHAARFRDLVARLRSPDGDAPA